MGKIVKITKKKYIKSQVFSIFIAISLAGCAHVSGESNLKGQDWSTYGHDKGGQRFSPLRQIDSSNVNELKPAWVYHMRPANLDANPAPSATDQAQRASEGVGPPARRPSRFSQSEATPLVINGIMYIATPYRKIVALNAQTGQEIWSKDMPNNAIPAQRGMEYWAGDNTHNARLFTGTRDGKLIAINPQNGELIDEFGEHGILNLKTPEIMRTTPNAMYGMTSPPLVVGNLVITGAATQENPAIGSSGAVRAWDAINGKLVWTFNTIPEAGQIGHDSWENDSGKNRSGVNVWGFMTADVNRGIVYLPLGAPAWDRYGGDRHGNNLFSSSIVAIDANTGQYKWHFQIVHHDIWDMDAEAPPTLFDVVRNGVTIPAVGIISKSGLFFLLNRVTGEAIDPIEERAVPASDVPNEQASPTQPFPIATPPIARQGFSMEDLADVTPEHREFCRNLIEQNNVKFGGPYTPIAFNRATINFPGRQGGANWGGGSFNPQLGYFFVNINNLGQVEMLTQDANGNIKIAGASGPSARFSNPANKWMCQKPPWGEMVAIDVKTGAVAWHKNLGTTDALGANSDTGRPNVGGSITTASGLVFIAATDDSRFRAFDGATGREVWTYNLPASAHATPITYSDANGNQYIAIVSTGGSFLDSPVQSDEIISFSLPK